jgi:hypothetical protein
MMANWPFTTDPCRSTPTPGKRIPPMASNRRVTETLVKASCRANFSAMERAVFSVASLAVEMAAPYCWSSPC